MFFHAFRKEFLRISIVFLACIALIFSLCLTGCSGSSSSGSSSGSLASSSNSSSASAVLPIDATCEKATVVGIVDGDTITVKINGSKYKVRLIGCDCPESVAADESRNCEEGRIASKYTKSLVKQGQTVYLSKDVSDTDQYDRLLRYVWLEEPSGTPTEDEACEKMLNTILVKEGYAQVKTYKPDTSLDSFFRSLGKTAIKEGKGVSYKWA